MDTLNEIEVFYMEKDDSGYTKENINSRAKIKYMPLPLRIVVAIASFLASLYLTMLVIDTAFSEFIISQNRIEAKADVVNKVSTHGKNGYIYYISYVFTVGTNSYNRTYLFGLFPMKTKVTKPEYDSTKEGSSISVVYASTNPAYNLPVNIGSRHESNMFHILGALVFGILSINEFRGLAKNKVLKSR